ncbi:hypothetical protein TNCT_471641 [Trichonephila clavata]|uniref:Uncharacterized protein n=1 Tax=Trichonephila clavata TaxID=2740835 RepID=A0A8X6GZP9_TRICU|nr:hypothetical protein TNCT_471641 [Trichonephila clavata]
MLELGYCTGSARKMLELGYCSKLPPAGVFLQKADLYYQIGIVNSYFLLQESNIEHVSNGVNTIKIGLRMIRHVCSMMKVDSLFLLIVDSH